MSPAGKPSPSYYAPGTVILAGDDDVIIVPDDRATDYLPPADRFIPSEGDEIWHIATCPGVVGHFAPSGMMHGPANRPTRRFTVVNTVNTVLDRKYDFGVHASGCSDLRKGENYACAAMGQTWNVYATDAQAVVNAEIDDLRGDFGDDAESFSFRIFPCCN
jgi:hypothetical protein